MILPVYERRFIDEVLLTKEAKISFVILTKKRERLGSHMPSIGRFYSLIFLPKLM